MFRYITKAFLVGLLLSGPVFPAQATTITANVSKIVGNTWQYSYTVSNDTLAVDIEEFTVYFDANVYEKLAVVATPVGWDPFVTQPFPPLSVDGFFDALSFWPGIASGNVLAGFSVQVDFLRSGAPGVQRFDVVNPNNFALLESEVTRLVAAPEPTVMWLSCAGILSLVGVGIFVGCLFRTVKSSSALTAVP